MKKQLNSYSVSFQLCEKLYPSTCNWEKMPIEKYSRNINDYLHKKIFNSLFFNITRNIHNNIKQPLKFS